MASHVEKITDENFEREVLASEQPYLLDFSATWCSPCKALDPMIEELAAELKGQLRVGKVDIDDAPEIAARFGVRGAPTLLLFRDGQEAARRIGLPNRKALRALSVAAT
jgi:thioredoxin 1